MNLYINRKVNHYFVILAKVIKKICERSERAVSLGIKSEWTIWRFTREIFSLPCFLFVPCLQLQQAVAAHHRQFSVLVTLRHPLYSVGSSWSIVLHYQGGLHCQALQSLQVSVGHLLVNHSFGFLWEVGEGFAHLGVNYSVKLSCHLCTGLGM